MSAKIFLASAFASITGSENAAPDELCRKLDQFERRAAREANPQTIEVFWNYDRSAVFSLACKHEKNGAGKALCAWLPKHVSWEFDGLLPKRISACYGLPADKFGVGKFPTETVQMKSRRGGRLRMQTGRVGTENLPWLRLEFLGKAK
jgi:hypothetical protein